MTAAAPWRHESFVRAWLRRSITIPFYSCAALGLLVLTPLLLPVAAAAGIAQGRGLVLARCVVLANVYFLAELDGILASGLIWLMFGGWRRQPSQRYLDANFALQKRWASAIFAGARLAFGLRVRVEGDEALKPGPVIILARHASPLDNLVPAVFASARRGLRLRWVINRWLLRDPCLDVVGNRLPNAFVETGSQEPLGQSTRVFALSQGLGSDEGVLIYPEGAVFSKARLGRAIAREGAGGQPAEGPLPAYRHVLPPRSGAVVAALGALPEADVVLCAHKGLDAAGSYTAMLSGELVGADVSIAFRRIPRTQIPSDPQAQIRWLAELWRTLDGWIAGDPVPAGV